MRWPKTRQSTVQLKHTPHKRTKMLKIVIAPRKYFTSKNSPHIFFIFFGFGHNFKQNYGSGKQIEFLIFHTTQN